VIEFDTDADLGPPLVASWQGCSVIGDGTVHRIFMSVQRQYFAPPDLSRGNDFSKYR